MTQRWPALLQIAAAVLSELSSSLLQLDLEGVLTAMRSPRALLFGASPTVTRIQSASVGGDSLAEVLRAATLLQRAQTEFHWCDGAYVHALEAEFYLGRGSSAYTATAAAAAATIPASHRLASLLRL